jgi:cytochrome c oxidase cbb3-type subunit 3
MSEHPNQDQHGTRKEDLPPGVELRPHVFDGIEEFDQRLPNWWLWTFYGAIIFFVIWWVAYYQFGWGKDDAASMAEFKAKVAEIQAAKLQEMFSTDPNGTLWRMSLNSASVDKGKAIFETKCVVCHGKDLSGTQDGIKLAGLPLNDQEWKYGGTPFEPMKVFNIIKEGSPDKAAGMQAWVGDIGLDGVADVAAYVLSHHEAPPEATKEPAAEPAPAVQ